jgi:hypothetical protein
MPKVGIKRAIRTAGRSVYRRRNPEPFHSLVRDHAFGSYIVIPEENQDGDVDWSVEADLIDPETGDLESYSASFSFDNATSKVTLNKAFEVTGELKAPSLNITSPTSSLNIGTINTSTLNTSTLNTGTSSLNSSLSFGARGGQHINLWHLDYGLGIQANTFYLRTGRSFNIYWGGVHNDSDSNPGGGTRLFTVDPGFVTARGELSIDPTDDLGWGIVSE